MIDIITNINQVIYDFVWGPVMLIFLVGVGIFYTIRLKGFQVSKIGLWMKNTVVTLFSRKKTAGKGAITPFQALTTALAATVGTGNMVGVTTAIVTGGPGAIFWMWISAFFGMMTKYAEIVLSLHFRKRNAAGEWVGGPMYYISGGLGKKAQPLAVLFAVFGVFASFGIGNMTQINSIASSVETLAAELNLITAAAPNAFSPLKLIVGIILSLVVALVVIGGMKRIGSITEKIVPFMCIFYIIGGIVVLFLNRNNIMHAFSMIFGNAFNFRSAAGGALGYTMANAMRYGIARGVFSNEAGLGSAPIAHAAADTTSPVKQGMWGIFEVFVDTILICTFTALVVLTSGAYTGPNGISGAPLTIASFNNSFGVFGTFFVTLCICLFAFSTVLSWSLYGQRCFEYLFKGKGVRVYQIIFVLAIIVSAIMRLELAWSISDTLNGLMAIPNLIALAALSGIVVKLTKEYLLQQKTGKIKN